jgi:hypothetical protein
VAGTSDLAQEHFDSRKKIKLKANLGRLKDIPSTESRVIRKTK